MINHDQNTITTLDPVPRVLASELSALFLQIHGSLPDLSFPRTLSEKILHRKLFERDVRMPALADKIRAKLHVAQTLGQEWVIPLFWSGHTLPPRELRTWPHPYVIKANHGSRWNYFVFSPDDEDWERIEFLTQSWLGQVYGVRLGEWLYSKITPQLLVEPFLAEKLHNFPVDYKFLVFHGEVKYIDVVVDRANSYRSCLYDRNWNYLGAAWGGRTDSLAEPIDPPVEFEQMVIAAQILGRDFSFVRVDFYEFNKRPFFGELTFYPGSGCASFSQTSLDLALGELWRYPTVCK